MLKFAAGGNNINLPLGVLTVKSFKVFTGTTTSSTTLDAGDFIIAAGINIDIDNSPATPTLNFAGINGSSTASNADRAIRWGTKYCVGGESTTVSTNGEVGVVAVFRNAASIDDQSLDAFVGLGFIAGFEFVSPASVSNAQAIHIFVENSQNLNLSTDTVSTNFPFIETSQSSSGGKQGKLWVSRYQTGTETVLNDMLSFTGSVSEIFRWTIMFITE